MDRENIKRILVYTHNSIGLGHAFRTLAAITGIKKWRPDIDFLVISGTSIQQIFFKEGIEVIKLPSIKLDIDHQDSPMHSRYLSGFDLETIFDFRQSIIMKTFDFFQPDALIIEHNMTGQMSELIPLLMKKWMRKGGPVDFALAHICRGIMKWIPLLQIPYQNPRHRSESINIGELYDFMYVLEDREVIDINKEFLGNDPDLEKKIRYLGKITNKVYGELPSREETFERFGLMDRKIILISLGRNNKVGALAKSLLEALEKTGLRASHQIVIVVDPYLDPELNRSIKDHPLSNGVRFKIGRAHV
jgi:predicted glycosyltransferase